MITKENYLIPFGREWQTLNFTSKEFDSPDSLHSGNNMSRPFIQMLQQARCKAGVPFKINSGYRTLAHNKKVGGVSNSAHTLGVACDIKCENSQDRYLIVKALLEVGFTRIGVYETFIHCDIDPTKPQKVIWRWTT